MLVSMVHINVKGLGTPTNNTNCSCHITCLTNHMESKHISGHIIPQIVNILMADTRKHTPTSWIKAILRNRVHTWFNNGHVSLCQVCYIVNLQWMLHEITALEEYQHCLLLDKFSCENRIVEILNLGGLHSSEISRQCCSGY